ncbi:MAG: O-antigen ligase domain-containing protein [Planctomycetota bacterium]|jgi:hypothetical protein
MDMSWTVSAAMYGWIPFVVIAFAMLPPPKAVVFCYLVGWLFLPVVAFKIVGFVDYSKSTAVPMVIFAAIAVFDGGRLARFRLRIVDLPMMLYCAVPLTSSLSNDLGWYDGLSGALLHSIKWGLPYLAGRLYCSSPEGLRTLALALVTAACVYIPLCLWEIRMSPQLHIDLYGFHQHSWTQVMRGTGYRPTVFMHHGLMVGLWMAAGSLAALAIWASGAVRRFWGLPMALPAMGLVGTTLLCNSFGAVVVMLLGGMTLLGTRVMRSSLPMALLLCLPTAYVTARISGDWSGTELVDLASKVNADRAGSLGFRIQSEELLMDTAMQRPIFGWAGWGRSLVSQVGAPGNRERVTPDSLWILAFGKFGFVGLTSLLLLFLVPVLTLWRRIPPRSWADREAVFAWALALVFTVYAIDNLYNAMHNPIFMIIAGALCGMSPGRGAPAAEPELTRARRSLFLRSRADAT